MELARLNDVKLSDGSESAKRNLARSRADALELGRGWGAVAEESPDRSREDNQSRGCQVPANAMRNWVVVQFDFFFAARTEEPAKPSVARGIPNRA